jgi:hypothetical protein
VKPLLRDLISISTGAVAWTGLTGLAVICLSGPMLSQDYHLPTRGLLGYASAFAVASAISGSVATAIYGDRRRSLGLGILLLALFALSVLSVRQILWTKTAPNVSWFQREWNAAAVCLAYGAGLGASCGLIASAIVGVFALLTRRRTTWRVGLAAAIGLIVAGFWALPAAIPWMTDLSISHSRAHGNYGMSHDEAIRNAGVGAMVGALSGAVVLAFVARVSGSSNGGLTSAAVTGWRTTSSAPRSA